MKKLKVITCRTLSLSWDCRQTVHGSGSSYFSVWVDNNTNTHLWGWLNFYHLSFGYRFKLDV